MKLAIMQPYAFPYLGYFQLVQAVDAFVLLDDVAYPKQGWVNRNRIGGRKGPLLVTFPVRKPRLGQEIRDMRLSDFPRHAEKFLRTLESVYRRAPFYEAVRPVLERAVRFTTDDLAAFASESLAVLAHHLGIVTPLIRASERYPRNGTCGIERVIDICLRAGAATYVNAEGGMALYRAEPFARRGIELRFLVHRPRPYPQLASGFIPRLSIIDALMFNAPEEMAAQLASYSIIPAPQM